MNQEIIITRCTRSNQQVIITKSSGITDQITHSLKQQGYSPFVIEDSNDLNLHNFENLVAIFDFNNIDTEQDELSLLHHNTSGIAKLLNIANEQGVPFILFSNWQSSLDTNSSIHSALDLMEKYKQLTNVAMSFVELGDVYGSDVSLNGELGHMITGIVENNKIPIDEETQNTQPIHITDITNGIARIIDDIEHNRLSINYTLTPEEPITTIELAYFIKSLTDLDLSVSYGKNPTETLIETSYPTVYPVGWNPQITLENGLKQLLAKYDIPITDDVENELENEQLVLNKELFAEQAALQKKIEENQKRFEELFEVTEPKQQEPADPDLTTDTTIPDDGLSFVEVYLEENELPPQTKSKLFSPSKKIVIVLATLLFLLLALPSISYSYALGRGLYHFNKASEALQTLNVNETNTQSEKALAYLDSLDDIPKPVLLAAKLLSLSESDITSFVAITRNASEVSNLLSGIQYSVHFTGETPTGTPTVLGTTTQKKANESLIRSVELTNIIEKDISNSSINNALASSYIDSLSKNLQSGKEILSKIKTIEPALETLLGYANPQTYVVVFQNTQEARSLGGTIDSYAIATIDKGEISIEALHNSKELDAQLETKEGVAPPPLQLRRAFDYNQLYLKDATWNPSFIENAKKIESLYTAATNEIIDGVISIDTHVIHTLLDNIGEVYIDSYNETITPNNLSNKLLQYSVPENELSDRPTFATEVYEAVLKNALASESADLLLDLFENLQQKHIHIYHHNGPVMSALLANEWAGALSLEKDDYVYITDSNISENKANSFVKRSIEYTATQPTQDSGFIRTVRITYKHHGMTDDWPLGDYLNHVRIIVPQHAFLNSAKIISDGEEKNITRKVTVSPYQSRAMYETDILIETGKTVTFEVEYESSRKNFEDQSVDILIQKQAGTDADPLTIIMQYPFGLPENFDILENAEKQDNKIIIHTDLKEDRLIQMPL